MRTLSEAHARAAVDGGVPDPEPVTDGLWSLPIPMPGGHLAYTLSAVHVGEVGGVTVVDPGWDTPAAVERLDALLAKLGRRIADVATIIVTHAHPDHVGAAPRLRAASGARLLMHEHEQSGIDRERTDLGIGAGRDGQPGQLDHRMATWGVPGSDVERVAELTAESRADFIPAEPADALLRDGDRVPIPGLDWRVLATPGHTAGHICLVDDARRLILTGDHVIPHVFPGIGLGAGGGGPRPVEDALASLARLAPYDEYDVLPGHGYRFHGLRERRVEMTAHILRRAREVAAAIAADPAATVWEVASRLTWSAGWARLSQGPMLPSALMQTEMHVDFVRAGGLQRWAAELPEA